MKKITRERGDEYWGGGQSSSTCEWIKFQLISCYFHLSKQVKFRWKRYWKSSYVNCTSKTNIIFLSVVFRWKRNFYHFFCFIERMYFVICITSYLIAVSERFENYKTVTFFNLHLVLVRKAGWPGDMTLLWSLRFHGDGKRWQKKVQRRIILNTSLRAA